MGKILSNFLSLKQTKAHSNQKTKTKIKERINVYIYKLRLWSVQMRIIK